MPQVSFTNRISWQTWAYDWLGNTSTTRDDTDGFYDRSLGAVTNSSTQPYQLQSASNETTPGSPINKEGHLTTTYDAAGNLTELRVLRNGTCIPTGAKCNNIYEYRWDEVGRLVRARRWDVTAANINAAISSLPAQNGEAINTYDASDERVIEQTYSPGGTKQNVFVFDTLDLRRTLAVTAGSPPVTTYPRTKWTEVPYLFVNGVRIGRVVYNDASPEIAGNETHVFLEIGDHLGSTSVVIDLETGELVERGTYQPYGAKESDYRPERWQEFREEYGFTGKEEDVQVGLTYFGKRFLSPYLNRWVSADPLAIHGLAGDFNVYAYVEGMALRAVDPFGLDGEERLNSAVSVSDAKVPKGVEYFAFVPKGEGRSFVAPADRGEQAKWAESLPEHVTLFRAVHGGDGMSLEDAKLWAALDHMSRNVAERREGYNDLVDRAEAITDLVPILSRPARAGMEIARAITNARFDNKEAEINEQAAAIVVPRGHGTIYRVPGSGTESGKPYIGRHNTDDPQNNRRSDDGRDRKKARVIDTYDKTKPEQGPIKEQKALNAAGGLKKTDNVRNEVAESKWKSLGIPKPKTRPRRKK